MKRNGVEIEFDDPTVEWCVTVSKEFMAEYWRSFARVSARHRWAAHTVNDLGWAWAPNVMEEYLAVEEMGPR